MKMQDFHLRLVSSIWEPVSRVHAPQGVLRNELGRSAGHAEKRGSRFCAAQALILR